MAVLYVTIVEGNDLKNVNWKNAQPLAPFVVVWLDPLNKSFTNIDNKGDTSPWWDKTFSFILNPGPISYSTLQFEVLHAGCNSPQVGSAKLKLHDKVNGLHTLELIRPSGRKQGTIEVEVLLRESLPSRHLGHRQRDMPSSVKSNDLPAPAWHPIFHHRTPPTSQPRDYKGQNRFSTHKPLAKMGKKFNTCAAAGRGSYQSLDDDEEEDHLYFDDSDDEGQLPRKSFHSDQREMHPPFSRSSSVSMLSEIMREKFEKVSLKRDDEDVCADSPRLFIYSPSSEMEESCGSNLTPQSTALYPNSSGSRPASMQSSNMGGKGPQKWRKT